MKIIPDHTKSAEDLFVGIVDNYISIDWDDAVPIIWLLADMLELKEYETVDTPFDTVDATFEFVDVNYATCVESRLQLAWSRTRRTNVNEKSLWTYSGREKVEVWHRDETSGHWMRVSPN